MRRGLNAGWGVAMALAVAGCQGDPPPLDGEGGGDGLGPTPVTVRFAARSGQAAASCQGTLGDLGGEGGTPHLRDARFFVHDLRLVAVDGSEAPITLDDDGVWQNGSVALVDLEDGTGTCKSGTPGTHEDVTGTAPAGRYVGLRFKVGVPFEQNHADPTTAKPPLDTSALFWGWGEGYMFFQLSMMTTPPDGAKDNAWVFALASMGCEGDPRHGEVVACSSPNRPEVDLEVFDPEADAVVLDLASLLDGAKLVSEHGCSSAPNTPACGSLFARIGLDYATGASTPTTSSAFVAAPR